MVPRKLSKENVRWRFCCPTMDLKPSPLGDNFSTFLLLKRGSSQSDFVIPAQAGIHDYEKPYDIAIPRPALTNSFVKAIWAAKLPALAGSS